MPATESARINCENEIRPFDFSTDTFAFANELIWEYRFDAAGKTTICRNDPPPRYAHHCFVVVRSARQFFLHATFRADVPAVDDTTYGKLIRAVVARSPQKASSPDEQIIFPGFSNLRQFSAAHTDLLQQSCGGAWQSYVQRGNWRMVFPFTRRHQEKMSGQLVRAIRENKMPIVHVVTFPKLSINHVLLLFAWTETNEGIQFTAYDPNIPAKPVTLFYKAATKTFFFPATHYFAGDDVNVYEVYRGLLL